MPPSAAECELLGCGASPERWRAARREQQPAVGELSPARKARLESVSYSQQAVGGGAREQKKACMEGENQRYGMSSPHEQAGST